MAPLDTSTAEPTMPLSADDHIAIQQLYARYVHHWAAGRGPEWAACFTPDGSFGSPLGTFTGTEQLAGLAGGPARPPTYRPWINHLVIEPAADGARGSCFALIVDVGTTPPKLRGSGTYEDTLVRHEGEWKFRTRTLHWDQPRLDRS
jgi:hypothetical protein